MNMSIKVTAKHSAAIAAALNMLGKKKEKMPAVPVGTHDLEGVKVVITLSGKAKKGEAYEYTPTAEIPMIPVLCLLLKKTGCVGPNVLNMIVESMNEAVAAKEKGEEAMKELMADYEKAKEKVEKTLKKLDPKMKAGNFTVNDLEASFAVVDSHELTTVKV